MCYRFHFITFGNGFGCFIFFPPIFCVCMCVCTVFHWKEDHQNEEKKTIADQPYFHTFSKCYRTENAAIVMDFGCRAEGKIEVKMELCIGIYLSAYVYVYVCMCMCWVSALKRTMLLLMQVRQIDWCSSLLYSPFYLTYISMKCIVESFVSCFFLLIFFCKAVRFLLASKQFLSIDS